MLAAGCQRPGRKTVVVFAAASLARAFSDLKETLESGPGLEVQLAVSGSQEACRKVAELGHRADLVATADFRVIDRILRPAHADFTVRFTTNELVLVHLQHSRFTEEISAKNWFAVLLRPGVRLGMASPDLAPIGYATLLAWQLAELSEGTQRVGADLAGRLRSRIASEHVTSDESELLQLLQSRAIDYAFMYRSSAEEHNLKLVQLPDAYNLGAADRDDDYARASVQVRMRNAEASKGDPWRAHRLRGDHPRPGSQSRGGGAVPGRAARRIGAARVAAHRLSAHRAGALRRAVEVARVGPRAHPLTPDLPAVLWHLRRRTNGARCLTSVMFDPTQRRPWPHPRTLIASGLAPPPSALSGAVSRSRSARSCTACAFPWPPACCSPRRGRCCWSRRGRSRRSEAAASPSAQWRRSASPSRRAESSWRRCSASPPRPCSSSSRCWQRPARAWPRRWAAPWPRSGPSRRTLVTKVFIYGVDILSLYLALLRRARDWLGLPEGAGWWALAVVLLLVAVTGATGGLLGRGIGREAARQLETERAEGRSVEAPHV